MGMGMGMGMASGMPRGYATPFYDWDNFRRAARGRTAPEWARARIDVTDVRGAVLHSTFVTGDRAEHARVYERALHEHGAGNYFIFTNYVGDNQ